MKKKSQMIEGIIRCSNHENQPGVLFIMNDDFDPDKRIICRNCLDALNIFFMSINIPIAQPKFQKIHDRLYENIQMIVSWILKNNQLNYKLDFCEDSKNYKADYEHELLDIENLNSTYSFNVEVEKLKLYSFKNLIEYDQAYEQIYLDKITAEVNKIQNCQKKYISQLESLQSSPKDKQNMKYDCEVQLIKNNDAIFIETQLMDNIIQNQKLIQVFHHQLMKEEDIMEIDYQKQNIQ